MAPSIVFILSFVGCIAIARCVNVNLFGADPSGGMWGALVDTQGGSEATTRPSSGYKAKVFNKFINAASYDSVTKKVLFHTADPPRLYYGPLCAANRKSPRLLTDLEVVPLNDPKMGDCVNCETSAFATHNGVIYFLLFGEYMSSSSITRVVEIRSFAPCDECGDTGRKLKSEFSYLDVVKCSKVVVSVLKEKFTFLDFDDKEIKAAKSMKVVPKGDLLTFFFQLGNISRSDTRDDVVNMSLWFANTDGVVRELHSNHLAPRYSPWNLRALGSVDYRDSTVCWTAGDRLQCAEFENNSLKNVADFITTGEAASSQVCQGPERNLTAIVTGVAIGETGLPMSVIFGCYPQSPGTGGVGIVTINQEGVKSIQPVGTRNGPLLAGSIFLTEGFDESCAWEPEFTICLGQPNPTDGTSEPEGDDSSPEGEPEEDNEIPDDREHPEPEDEIDLEENGIEGGHENKGREDSKAVVGDNAAHRQKYHLSAIVSCLITLYVACLLRS